MKLTEEELRIDEVKSKLSQIILIARKADSEASNYLRSVVQRIIESRFQEEIRKTFIPKYYVEVPIIPEFHEVKPETITPAVKKEEPKLTLKVSEEKIVSKSDQLKTKRDELIRSIQTINTNEICQMIRKLKNNESILEI